MGWMNRGRGMGRSRTRIVFTIEAFIIAVLAACSSMSSDFDDMQEQIMPPSPTEAAIDMVNPYNPEKRRNGTVLIANAPFGGAEPYVNMYADKVQHEDDPLALAAAVQALGRHGMPEHAPLLAAHLTHESRQVRWEAAKALQRIHNPEVVSALISVVHERREDVDVRVAAADALGQYPEDRVFQALISAEVLGDRELTLNHAAQVSLFALTGQDFGDDQAAWFEWYNSMEEPFAGQQPYIYPIYARSETMMEKVAFWSKPTWEVPQQPAGLRPAGQRSTYEDAPETDDGGGQP